MWQVNAFDTENRTVDVIGSDGKTLKNLDVPVLLPFPELNAEVTVDEKTHSIICIINLNRRGMDSPDAPDEVYDEPCPDIKLTPGDMLYRIPGQGFFGTMKGFLAAIGAKSTGVVIDGLNRKIRAVSNDLDIYSENGSYRLKITAAENPDLEPSMVFNLGNSFKMHVDAGNGRVFLSFMDILTLNMTPDKLRVDLTNPLTKATVNLLDEDFKAQAEEAEEAGGTSGREEKISFNTKLRVTLSEAMVSFAKLTATGSDVLIAGSKALRLSGEKMTIKSGSLSANVNEMSVDLGENGKSGSFHVNNGMHSHFRMDEDIRMFGTEIKILGDTDNVVSGFYMELILETLLMYLNSQAMTLSAIYPLASIGGTWQASEAIIRETLMPYLKNPDIKTNLPTVPPAKPLLP